MEDEEDEDLEFVPLDPAPWSWSSFVAEAVVMVSVQVSAVADFLGAASVQFQRMHNRFVDDSTKREDGERFATDILSGLKDL